jgi:beta-glucosidase
MSPTWRDEHLGAGQRAELLLAEMTTAEKCHQLTARMAWSLCGLGGWPMCAACRAMTSRRA